MLDAHIRQPLVNNIQAKDPHARVYHEFQLCRGIGRADLAVVNGTMAGFEIKSEKDSLDRLPIQIQNYDKVFNYSTVVIAERHLKGARKLLPRRWGITVAYYNSLGVQFDKVRKPTSNCVDPQMQLRILWRTELVRALRNLGHEVRHDDAIVTLWEQAERYMSNKEIAQAVRSALKSRST